MATLEAPLSAKVTDKPPDPAGDRTPAAYPPDPADRLPAPRRAPNGRDGATEVLQQCLDLAVTGNLAANKTIRKFAATVDRVAPLDAVGPARQRELIVAALEMTRRLAHAPLDVGHSLVQSAVLVDVGVDVDVDIASQHVLPQQIEREERS